MQSNRVTMITLATRDLDRARSYYKALGWHAEEINEKIAIFGVNGAKFAIYKCDALEEDLKLEIPVNTGAISLAQNFNSPSEVDEWHQRALKAGAKEVTAPKEVFWGGYSGYHIDPDGHLWEFAHNPFWDLDENGQITK